MRSMDTFEILTFDCYGTIVDWETGLWDTLRPILAAHGVEMDVEEALSHYGGFESEAEKGTYRSYRTVLADVLDRFGVTCGFTPSDEERARFAGSVGRWPPFPDSTEALMALKKKFKLAIVSNVDDDLFAGTAKQLGIVFDRVVTAQQIRAYKPSPVMFAKAFEAIGTPRDRILHVAQSLYHDVGPASALGVSTVWIDRRQGRGGTGATPPAEAKPDLTFPDLRSLALYAGVL
ncbi:MAG: haloacid dehalogenase type II [candidate division Zixibacteria bacterium]|nr:haloacid dehalogenase type II [candidate division Zixibacteria bacterium]